MRVAFVTDTYFPHITGVAVSIQQFYRTLTDLGFEIDIFAPEVKEDIKDRPNVIRLSSIRLWPTLPEQTRIPSFPFKNYSKLFSGNYDLIHSQGGGIFSLVGLIAAKQKKIPCVMTYHTNWRDYTHYFFNGKLITPVLVDKINQKFGNAFDALITPSQKIKTSLQSSGVKKRVEVIPSFLDYSKFENVSSNFIHQKLNLEKDTPIILTAGRLALEKNFEFLLEVFAQIEPHFPHVRFVFAGDGPDRLHLETLVKNLKLDSKILFLGNILPQDMPKVYHDASLFTFASTSETQGLVVLEAAASGLPLVLIDDSAYAGTIQNGLNGYLIPTQNKSEFAQKIIKLLEDNPLRKKMGQASKSLVQQNFNSLHLTQKLVNLYQSLV